MHNYMDKVPVKIRITNTGSEPLYIGLNGAMAYEEGMIHFTDYFWKNIPSGPVDEVKNRFYFTDWDVANQQSYNKSICALHTPGEASTLTIGVPVIGGDTNNDTVIRTLKFWFVPKDAWEASPPEAYAGKNMPDNWPWPNQKGALETDFSFGLQPALEARTLSYPVNVGENWSIRIFADNIGSRNLFNWEAERYKWDKNTGDYVFAVSSANILIPSSAKITQMSWIFLKMKIWQPQSRYWKRLRTGVIRLP